MSSSQKNPVSYPIDVEEAEALAEEFDPYKERQVELPTRSESNLIFNFSSADFA